MPRLLALLLLLLALGCCIDAAAQNVERQGNTFVQSKKTRTPSEGTKTAYTFKASDGKEYPVYLSSKGKAYIVRVSKKTGKEYRQYIPEVGKQINPEAYKDK